MHTAITDARAIVDRDRSPGCMETREAILSDDGLWSGVRLDLIDGARLCAFKRVLWPSSVKTSKCITEILSSRMGGREECLGKNCCGYKWHQEPGSVQTFSL